MTAVVFVRDLMAAHRLTRLATTDSITEPARAVLIVAAYRAAGLEAHAWDLLKASPHSTWTERAQDDPDAPWPAQLITCRWCAGWWISLAIVVARRRWPRGWALVADTAACSSAAGLLAHLE